MAVTITRPSGRRADDVRALRFRFRTLTFSGSYATGGETITAKSVGLKRVLGVLPMDLLARPAAAITGTVPVFDVSTDGTTVTVRHLTDAAGAAQATVGVEKTAGAYTGTPLISVLFVGE